MSEKKIMICFKINPEFNHHKKLRIGKRYLIQKNNDKEFVAYNEEDGSYIGFFPSENFISIDEFRDYKINKLIRKI
jgi:hypothetical protein